jgi:hypothetical protein
MITLALRMGLNTTIFSLINRPLKSSQCHPSYD